MINTQLKKDHLNVKIFSNKDEMGNAAAISVAEKLNAAISEKGFANLILATGASQFQFLEHLQQQIIDWKKITVFHLDEYKGMPVTHPASFRKYLKERILDKVQPKQVHYLNGDAADAEAEVLRYENLLKEHPVDIACIGIGENGHIAFNDPPVADFNDPKLKWWNSTKPAANSSWAKGGFPHSMMCQLMRCHSPFRPLWVARPSVAWYPTNAKPMRFSIR